MKLKSFFTAATIYGCGTFCFAMESSILNYSYSVPWSGGATITIYNNSNVPTAISSLIFTNNTEISGDPWGALYAWGSTVQNTLNSDGMHITHTITEGSKVIIPAQTNGVPGSVSLTYNIGKINGVLSPYHAAMDPIEIQVIVNDEKQIVPIQGKCNGDTCKDPGNGKQVAGYFINWAHWRTPSFDADNVMMPYDKINTLNYAFFIFDSDGRVSLYDQDSDQFNLPIISQKRKQLPYLNASISLGGWSWASTPPGWHCSVGASPQGPAACFKTMAADTSARSNFVNNAIKAMKQVNFNGIDIDWEYPETTQDAVNFVQLIKELRQGLDIQGKIDNTHYRLTIATSAGIDKIKVFTSEQWQAIANNVDSIGVMTYDFHGDWDKGNVGSDFQSAMQIDPIYDPTSKDPVLSQYSLIGALKQYTDINHVPADKLVVGIPMYGRMVNVTGAADKPGNAFGLYRTILGAPQGEFDNQQSGFTGLINYKCIVDRTMCGNHYPLPDLTLVDPTQNAFGAYALTPWGYSDSFFVTYDDAKSAAYKANWVMQQHFAGVMLWDLTGDFKDTDDRSIINAIYKVFRRTLKNPVFKS